MSWKTGVSRGFSVALAMALASGCLGPGSTVTSSATATEGSGGTETSDTATTTTEGTQGMSSTSVGSSAGTTGTTSTTTTTSTGASTTTGCTFLCMPDGGPGDRLECDVWSQNCPEGEKCMPYASDGGGAWNASKCSPIDPDPDDVGEPCTVEESGVSGVDSCVKGTMCWNVDPETNTGVCTALCQGSEQQCSEDPASCCPPAHACTIASLGVLILCLQTCDPILQNCEGAGEVCYPVGNSFQCAPDVSGEMGAVGDPCEFINVCDPATFCGNPAAYPGCDPMAGGCCIPFCELDNPDCVAGTECAPWYDPMDVPPGYENLGACVIPG